MVSLVKNVMHAGHLGPNASSCIRDCGCMVMMALCQQYEYYYYYILIINLYLQYYFVY